MGNILQKVVDVDSIGIKKLIRVTPLTKLSAMDQAGKFLLHYVVIRCCNRFTKPCLIKTLVATTINRRVTCCDRWRNKAGLLNLINRFHPHCSDSTCEEPKKDFGDYLNYPEYQDYQEDYETYQQDYQDDYYEEDYQDYQEYQTSVYHANKHLLKKWLHERPKYTKP